MHSSQEKELVRLAQRDPEAFAGIYDHYYPKIFEYALKRTANLQAAHPPQRLAAEDGSALMACFEDEHIKGLKLVENKRRSSR